MMNQADEVEAKSHNAMLDARRIFLEGVARVDPARLLDFVLERDGGKLLVRHSTGELSYDLDKYRHVFVLGMGKASAVLAERLEEILGDRIDDGFVVAKTLSGESCEKITLVEAGHPIPDARSVDAGARALALATRAAKAAESGERSLVFVLISGGGSALLASPAPGISFADKAEITKLLLGSGATIQEMNAVRKHLSAVKGGRLAAALAPADVVSLVLSDVIGDDLDAIASGPTVPDNSTWESARAVLVRSGIWEAAPESVRALFTQGCAGLIEDTPKPGDRCFERTATVLVGSNILALRRAAEIAERLGYSTLLLTSRLVGEAREIGKLFGSLAGDIALYGSPIRRPACVLAGGETTVTLRGTGKGGRNQEMALAVLCSLDAKIPGHSDLVFLSGGTDGNDGPTDAAGAFASMSLKMEAAAAGLEPGAYLANNDSYHFFKAVDGLLVTGSTGTNVCDMQILLLP